jgi:hypothetical protein
MSVSTQHYTENQADLAAEAGRGLFEWVETDEKRWDKSFPFQLAVLKAEKTGYSFYKNTIFTLPIGPEDMTVATPFAITAQATLGGVVEQHGGAPFRQIAFSGSLGVLPVRGSGETLGKVGSALRSIGSITGGTLDATLGAANDLWDSAVSVGDGGFKTNQYEDEVPVERGTGYWQFLQLQKFLESYVEAKKSGTEESRHLRLALLVWKEKAAYVVTPRVFHVTRSASSPFEYRYSLTLQAWRRVDATRIVMGGFDRPGFVDVSGIARHDARWFKQALTKVEQSRKVLAATRNVITSVRRDFETTVGGSLRSVALFLKDAGATAKAAYDFPDSLRRSWETVIVPEWERIKRNWHAIDPTLKEKVERVDEEVAAKQSGTQPSGSALADLLSDPDHFDFQGLIDPDVLPLPPEAREAVDGEVARAASLTTDDFARMRDEMLEFAADYADRVGLGDPAYNTSLGRSTSPQQREAVEEDIQALYALVEAAHAIGGLVVNPEATPRIPTTIEYVAGLANASGLEMRVPNSKFAAPFPYGYTLEKLAQEYLGDSTRWGEIAALNDLRAPWVDEVGVEHPLLVNGYGNEVVVEDASKLTLGQRVSIYSSSVGEEFRRVSNVEKVSAGYWRVTLDGEADLSRFTTLEGATLHHFLPGTVNSTQVIYIPSSGEAETEPRYVPNADDLGAFLTAGAVDGALTESGDLVITPDGDWPYVYGLAALVQHARFALLSATPQVGDSNADMSASDVVARVKAAFEGASSFTGVQSIVVERVGPTTRVALELGVRGSDTLLPVSFEVAR